MQTIEYKNLIDKSKWARGPWDAECDKIQWRDDATGLPCLIVRNNGGALCGYVGVSKTHPDFGKDEPNADIRVHGGITFASKCSGTEHGICHKVEAGEDDDVWWFGFDCAHSGDISPGYDSAVGFSSSLGESYRGIDYVRRQVESLAKQLSLTPASQAA